VKKHVVPGGLWFLPNSLPRTPLRYVLGYHARACGALVLRTYHSTASKLLRMALRATLRRKMLSRDAGSGLQRTDVHQRKAQTLPLVKAAQQRAHATNSDLPELQSHTGAGGFVRSSTEENDFAITGDFAAP